MDVELPFAAFSPVVRGQAVTSVDSEYRELRRTHIYSLQARPDTNP